MMLRDHQERERASSNLGDLNRTENDLVSGEVHPHNLTQNFAGPNINNMYALEDLDEQDPAGLRAVRVHQGSLPAHQSQQAFFARTQPGVRSGSSQGQIKQLSMNANPAYYQVMYNEMVQKNSS